MKEKTKYDSMTIVEIEKEIQDNRELSIEAKKEAIKALCVLRSTGRYKENPVYKKSSFENYLMGQFNIRYNTFQEEARAFKFFPEETVKYGVGLVAKIHRVCGAKNEIAAIREIKAADNKTKAPIQRIKIEEIIQKHSTRPVKDEKKNYKQLYLEEVQRHEVLKEKHREALEELKEARVQIGKLKRTVVDMKRVWAEELEAEATA